jgi:hypothetical protein
VQLKLDAAAAAAVSDDEHQIPAVNAGADDEDDGDSWLTLAACNGDATIYGAYLLETLRPGMKIKCLRSYDDTVGPEWHGDCLEVEGEEENSWDDEEFPMVFAMWRENESSQETAYWVPAKNIEIIADPISAVSSAHIHMTTKDGHGRNKVHFWAYIPGSEVWTGRVEFKYRQRMPEGPWNTWGAARHRGSGWW